MSTTARQLLKEGRQEEIWTYYCGYLDLSMEETMKIQRRLLHEQIQLMSGCTLGQQIFKGCKPESAEEFIETVPLTSYEDYAHYLLEKKEEVLPEKPRCWLRTSGRSGEYPMKWVPYTHRFWEKAGQNGFAAMVFGSASKRGDIILQPEDTVLFTLAPKPYMSGEIMVDAILHHFPFKFLPSPEEAEKMDFYQRIEEGLQLSFSEGLDVFYGIASILVAIGRKFEEGSGDKKKYASLLLKPKALIRLINGIINSRREKRALLPRDIWQPKLLAMGGMDCDIFRETVKYYWGGNPIEGYGITEAGILSSQTWNRKGQVFFPDINFLEFMPLEEHLKVKEDPGYTPKTYMMDQLKVGEIYELVITNFLGGPFMRYRVGDLVQIVALEDSEIGIELPHMKFYSRADDLIDIAGFTRLTEYIIWKAIQESGIQYTDWVACKESRKDKSFLHIYLDIKSSEDEGKAAEMIHGRLAQLDADYADLAKMLGIKPLKVTFLEPGAFQRYIEKMMNEGADLAHLKPPRINPSPKVMERLMQST